MDFYLQRLHDAISSATEGMNPEMLGRRPQAGKWCAAEVLEHLYLTYTGTIKGVEKCIAAGRPLARGRTLNDRMRTALVVSIGYLPGGRQAPQNAHASRDCCQQSPWGVFGKDLLHGRSDLAGGRKVRP